MAGPAARRPAVRNRLAAGFLAGLPAAVRELAELLAQPDPGVGEMASGALDRMAETAASLELSAIADAASRASARVASGETLRVLGPLVREVREVGGAGPFAPIAFVGNGKQGASLQGQDDGCAEPILVYPSVDALLDGMSVDWPQAVVLPTAAAAEVLSVAGALGCPVYLYGPSRDDAARRTAARCGATGYLSEPLVLPELLSHVRYHASTARSTSTVALIGDLEWADPTAGALEAAGLVPLWFEGAEVGTVLHGLYPDAVILGPGPGQRDALTTARGHVGRTHVALLAVGDPRSLALYQAGADDVLGPGDDVAGRTAARLARFQDFRRDRDDLTHVLNRAGALEAVHRWVAWGMRSGTAVSVCLVGADALGAVAQAHGREAGNACRRHLAAALERGLRRHDLVGALGPELFLAVLPGCRVAEAERRMAEIKSVFEGRVHADRRLRDVAFVYGAVDTSTGIAGLLPRALAALDAFRSAC